MSTWEPPKVFVTDRSGYVDVRVAFSSLNASVKDDAANTFNDPLNFAVVVDEPGDLLLLPHADARSAKQTRNDAARRRDRRNIGTPGPEI
jgi:hypothetical protein